MQSWDTANTIGELSDYSVCTTWGLKDRQIYLLDVLRRRLEYPDLKRAVRDQARYHKADIVLIEYSASGISLIQELIRRRLSLPRPNLHFPRTKPLPLSACHPSISNLSYAQLSCKGEDQGEGPYPARYRARLKIPPLPGAVFCHSERSEESRIFLGANHCTLNRGSTTPKAGGSEDLCTGVRDSSLRSRMTRSASRRSLKNNSTDAKISSKEKMHPKVLIQHANARDSRFRLSSLPIFNPQNHPQPLDNLRSFVP